MTVKDTVLEYINVALGPVTNADIAADLGISEPSVRRATLRLDVEQKIHFVAFTSRGSMLWGANQPGVQWCDCSPAGSDDTLLGGEEK